MDDLDELLGAPASGLDIPLAFTRFEDQKARTKTEGRLTLRDLAARIDDHVAEIKGDLPWIKLARFGDRRTDYGSLRHNANMLAITGIEGDYDDESVTVAEAAARLRAAGVAAWLYTSPSHTAGAPRWRVLAPLSAEHSVADRRELCGRLNAALGGILTGESFTDSQSYYFGRLVDAKDFDSVLVDGAPLDLVTGTSPVFPQGVSAQVAAPLDDLDLEVKRIVSARSFEDDLKSGRLETALKAIVEHENGDDSYRGDWAVVVQALCHASGGSRQGYDLWLEWAKNSPRARRADVGQALAEKQARRDWNRYSRRSSHGNPVTLASLYDLARTAQADALMADYLDDLDDLDEDEAEVAAGLPAVRDDLDDLLGVPASVDLGPLDKPEPVDPGVNPNREWTRLLAISEEGEIKVNLHNIQTIVQNDARLYGRLGHNLLLQAKVFVAEPGRLRKKPRDDKPILQLEGPIWELDEPSHAINGKRWVDDHEHALRRILEAPKSQGGYNLKVNDRDLRSAIANVANEHIFHPIRDRLRSFTWDGVARAEALFVDYLGCPDDAYHRQAARLMLLGAVARVFSPGHKFDFVPILEGAQGAGKSTFIRILGLDWAGELAVDFKDNNRIIEALQGAWIMEIPELQGFNKAETTLLKAVISRTHDKGRLAWEKNVREFPRQCIFIGSTNEDDYLRDVTGGRRFWPIRVQVPVIDTDRLRREVAQIWAEVVTWHDAMRREKPRGDLPLYMADQRAAETAKQLQEARRTETPDEILAAEIRRALDEPVSTDLDGNTVPRTMTCIKEVWVDLLGRDERELSSQMTTRLVGKALRLAGWVQAGTFKHPKYGTPKAFRRATPET